MSSTNKTSLGLNMWEGSDKPIREDFVKDNVIIDENLTKLNRDIMTAQINISEMKPSTSRTVNILPDGTYCHTLVQPGWYSVYNSEDSPSANTRWLIHVQSVEFGEVWLVTQNAFTLISGEYISPKTRTYYNNGAEWLWSPWG